MAPDEGGMSGSGSPGREREADGSPGARARDAVDPDDARYDSNAEVEYGDPDDRDDDPSARAHAAVGRKVPVIFCGPSE